MSDFGISPPGSPSSDDEVWDEFIDEPPKAKKARTSSLKQEEEDDDADADNSGDDDGDRAIKMVTMTTRIRMTTMVRTTMRTPSGHLFDTYVAF